MNIYSTTESVLHLQLTYETTPQTVKHSNVNQCLLCSERPTFPLNVLHYATFKFATQSLCGSDNDHTI